MKEKKGAFSQLRIVNAELIDQGWYKCEFGNINKSSIKVFLEVLKSEKTTTTPSTPSQAAMINQTTTLNVAAEKSRYLSFRLNVVFRLIPIRIEKILKVRLDSIPSPSHSVKIQIIGRKVY